MLRLAAFLGILMIISGCFVVKTLHDAGQFKKLQFVIPGDCKQIFEITGGEDLAIDHKRGWAFVAAHDRFPLLSKGQWLQGDLYFLDLNDPDPVPQVLTQFVNFKFHPHGLSLFEDEDSTLWIYVVNHYDEGHSIEVFSHKDNLFLHRNSISGPELISPNDIHAVGRDRFYVTNDHGSEKLWKKTMEDFLQLARSGVVYYDGKGFHHVAERLQYANGINGSADGKEIYVATTIGKEIVVYDRNPETGQLKEKERIQSDTGLDNIDVHPDGSLWVGAHPKLLTFVQHSQDTVKPSPSEVVVFRRESSGNWSQKTILLESGKLLPGSSVAARWKDRLLVGPVFANRLLICDL